MIPRCSARAVLLLSEYRVIPVASVEPAEVVKFLQNPFRRANIALANQIARTCLKRGVDVWEVIEASGG
jgi:UDP-N-acetyl-D-mannosaminuronate dehydrogenase